MPLTALGHVRREVTDDQLGNEDTKSRIYCLYFPNDADE